MPVSTNDSLYEVSFSIPHSKILSGIYRLEFYREVDRTRSIESLETKKGKKEEETTKPLFHIDLLLNEVIFFFLIKTIIIINHSIMKVIFPLI